MAIRVRPVAPIGSLLKKELAAKTKNRGGRKETTAPKPDEQTPPAKAGEEKE